MAFYSSGEVASVEVASVKAPSSERVEDLLFNRALVDPDARAIVSTKGTFTYQELADHVSRFAHDLLARGLKAGDRVGIYLDKTPECVVALFGTWAANGIAVPINEGLRSRQVHHILHDADCRFLVTAPRKLKPLGPECKNGSIVVDKILHEGEPPPKFELPAAERGDHAPAAILYTSGSSGRPKGILLSHANLTAGARIVCGYLEPDSNDRILSVLPFSFDYGLNQLLIAVRSGAVCVLQRGMLPAQICDALTEHEITMLAGVPPFWVQLRQEISPFTDMQFPRLRVLTNSGGAFPRHLVKPYQEQLPNARIYLMYGLSEAFRSTFLAPSQLHARPDSIGKAIPETELYLINEQGRECDIGEVGELVHRGPTVALGYWRNEAATNEVFRPNPLVPSANDRVVFTGDLARRDADGFLYFVGRNDQMIKSMGYRISPDDIEAQLRASGLVAEAVAGGKDDEIAGQVVVAHVVPSEPERFAIAHLMAFCRKEMPCYMVPRAITVHEKFPRTSSGKLDRQAVLA